MYPLYNQPPMSYSTFNNTNKFILNTINLGLAFPNPVGNESGCVEISNVSVAKYLTVNDNFEYLANGINTTRQILVPDNIYTNDSHINRISINFKEINPTKYIVNIKNANQPFIMSFKQSFNLNWKIYINNIESNDPHFTADMYYNGWLITQGGNYTITIVFGPQHDYNLIEGISFYSFLLSISTIILYQFYVYCIRGLKNGAKSKK